MSYQLPVSPDSVSISGHLLALGGSLNLAANDVAGLAVANISALRSATVTTLAATACFVEGYYAGADGGEGTFWFNSADITSADNGGTIIVDASSRRWYRATSGALSIEWFGAKGDGLTVNTAAIQACLGAGADIYVPPGIFLTGPLSLTGITGLHISGGGVHASFLNLNMTGSLLTLDDCQFGTIENITFQSNGTPQSISGAVGILETNNTGNTEIRRCNFLGFSGGGLQSTGTSGLPLSGNKVLNCYFLGNGSNQLTYTYSEDFHIEDNQFGTLTGIAHAATGCYLNNSSSGTYLANYHWGNVIGFMSGGSVGSNYNRIVGNRFDLNDSQGAYFENANEIVFTSNTSITNSQSSNGAYDNVYMTNVSNSIVANNISLDWSGGSTFHAWGINVDTGCSNLHVRNNQCQGFSSSLGPIRMGNDVFSSIDFDRVTMGSTTATVAANTTVYLGANGAQSSAIAASFLNSGNTTVAEIFVTVDAAPGTGQTFTYTLYVNGSPTSMTVPMSNAQTLAIQITTSPAVLLGDYSQFAIQLVTSAGAAAAHHQYAVKLASY